MKKIIFSVILFAASFTLFAQENPPVVIYRVNSIESNPAYSVPTYIRTNFETSNPGVTVTTWEPMYVWDPNTIWWHGTYNSNNNRIMHVYYNSVGAENYRYNGMNYGYNVALPVLQTFVPEDVITRAITLHGNNLYGITKMKGSDDMEVYQVNFLENGDLKSTWMDVDGTAVLETNVRKVKIDEDEIKIKSDTEKTKIKMDE